MTTLVSPLGEESVPSSAELDLLSLEELCSACASSAEKEVVSLALAEFNVPERVDIYFTVFSNFVTCLSIEAVFLANIPKTTVKKTTRQTNTVISTIKQVFPRLSVRKEEDELDIFFIIIPPVLLC